MAIVYLGTVEECITLVADVLAIAFYLTIFFTYVAWRLINARSGEGVQALYFVPPSISSKWMTYKQLETREEKPAQLVSPVVPVVSCTLLNPDIFSETLLDVSLSINNLATSTNYDTKIFWISESENPFTVKNNLWQINGGGLFGKR
ncbi:MAG: hypothetical protein WAL97_06695 [Halobacteriota archaeon]